MDFPPPTLHVFMGSYAPINQGFGSLYQTQPTSFFQDYRNETLSKFMVWIAANVLKSGQLLYLFLHNPTIEMSSDIGIEDNLWIVGNSYTRWCKKNACILVL